MARQVAPRGFAVRGLEGQQSHRRVLRVPPAAQGAFLSFWVYHPKHIKYQFGHLLHHQAAGQLEVAATLSSLPQGVKRNSETKVLWYNYGTDAGAA